jgi:ABC-type branched-subunit amino acid transport system ATPase component
MALLEVKEISVRFGGVQALDDVTFDVAEGSVTGLIGPNGAGKTTLFNVVTGLQAPNSGRIVLDGRDVTNMRPHRRARLGMARSFQRLETFGTLSVRDNVLVAAEMRRGWSRDGSSPRTVTAEILEQIGLLEVADERVDTLPTGTARLVEVARALAARPRLLLLDEPSAGLNEGETTDLGDLLVRLSATGLGVLLVEHDMRFVMGTCEYIHVLDFGRIIASGAPDAIQSNAGVRAAYLGAGPDDAVQQAKELDPDALADVEALAEVVEAETSPVVEVRERAADDASTESPGDATIAPALELRQVFAGYGTIDVLYGVDLVLQAGQVHALLGPNGAGKSTTLKVASGQIRPNTGEVLLDGVNIGKAGPDELARRGLCLVPEGRGVFPNLTVTENLRMATYAGTPLKMVLERAFTRFPRLAERRKQLAGTLSGGEQQMLAMARALAIDPKVLLLDELSMGLAPLIVEDLYAVVQRIASEGLSIVVVEQFAHQVLGVADVASIMLSGRVQLTGRPEDVAGALEAAYLSGAVDG